MDERGATPAVGTVLMIAVVILVAGTALVTTSGVAEDVRDPAPTVAVEASFDARYTPEPHWSFNLTHVAGDRVDPEEVRITVTDSFGNEGSVVLPETFESGDTLRIGF